MLQAGLLPLHFGRRGLCPGATGGGDDEDGPRLLLQRTEQPVHRQTLPFSAANRTKPKVGLCLRPQLLPQPDGPGPWAESWPETYLRASPPGRRRKPEINPRCGAADEAGLRHRHGEGSVQQAAGRIAPCGYCGHHGLQCTVSLLPCSTGRTGGWRDPSDRDDGAFLAVMAEIEEKVLDLKRRIEEGDCP